MSRLTKKTGDIDKFDQTSAINRMKKFEQQRISFPKPDAIADAINDLKSNPDYAAEEN